MLEWVLENIEGLIALFMGVLVPLLIMLGNVCKQNIIDTAQKKIKGVVSKWEQDLNAMKTQIEVLKRETSHIYSEGKERDKNIIAELEELKLEIEKLEELRLELQGTRELMLLQNNSLAQQITDFKDFIKSTILK